MRMNFHEPFLVELLFMYQRALCFSYVAFSLFTLASFLDIFCCIMIPTAKRAWTKQRKKPDIKTLSPFAFVANKCSAHLQTHPLPPSMPLFTFLLKYSKQSVFSTFPTFIIRFLYMTFGMLCSRFYFIFCGCTTTIPTLDSCQTLSKIHFCCCYVFVLLCLSHIGARKNRYIIT